MRREPRSGAGRWYRLTYFSSIAMLMATNSSSREEEAAAGRSWRKWAVGAVLLVFFSYLMWIVVNPYRDQPYEEVPHGDHAHYVPKDRNEDVPISRFPTEPPSEGERITPDGEVVSSDR